MAQKPWDLPTIKSLQKSLESDDNCDNIINILLEKASERDYDKFQKSNSFDELKLIHTLYFQIWEYIINNINKAQQNSESMLRTILVKIVHSNLFLLTTIKSNKSILSPHYHKSTITKYIDLFKRTYEYMIKIVDSSQFHTEIRLFCIMICVRAYFLFPKFRDSVLQLYSDLSLPVDQDLIPLCRLDNKPYKNKHTTGNILYIDHYDTKFSHYTHLFDINSEIHKLARRVIEKCGDISALHEQEIQKQKNLYGWYKYARNEQLSFPLSIEKTIALKNEFFIYFFSNIVKYISDKSKDICWSRMPDLFILVRAVFPVLQACIASNFKSTKGCIINISIPDAVKNCLSRIFQFGYFFNLFVKVTIQCCSIYNHADVFVLIGQLSVMFSYLLRSNTQKYFDIPTNDFDDILDIIHLNYRSFPFCQEHYSCFYKSEFISFLKKYNQNNYHLPDASIEKFLSSKFAHSVENRPELFFLTPKKVWFSQLEATSFLIPNHFELKNLIDTFNEILKTCKIENIIYILQFYYHNYEYFSGMNRLKIVKGLIFANFDLFYSYCPDIRELYHLILIYTILKNKRSMLDVRTCADLSSAIGISKPIMVRRQSSIIEGVIRLFSQPKLVDVFKLAIDSETDAVDIVISSKLECYLQNIIDQINNPTHDIIPELSRAYLLTAMKEFIDKLSQYESLDTANREEIRPQTFIFKPRNFSDRF